MVFELLQRLAQIVVIVQFGECVDSGNLNGHPRGIVLKSRLSNLGGCIGARLI